jgi:hypothetical protein
MIFWLILLSLNESVKIQNEVPEINKTNKKADKVVPDPKKTVIDFQIIKKQPFYHTFALFLIALAFILFGSYTI